MDDIKKDFLYFDKISYNPAITSLANSLISKGITSENDKIIIKSRLTEIEFLQKNEILIETDKEKWSNDWEYLTEQLPQKGMEDFNHAFGWVLKKFLREISHEKFEAMKSARTIDSYIKGLNQQIAALEFGGEVLNRLEAILRSQISDDEFYPIMETYNLHGLVGSRNEEVLRVILKKIPTIDESVTWERLIDFKKDSDSMTKFLALRNWMIDISRSQYSGKEIEEKFEYLLNEYEQHLKLHQLKYNSGILETIIVTGAELLETLATFKWSETVKLAFNILKDNVEMMEAEMNTPGREVAYISKINKTL